MRSSNLTDLRCMQGGLLLERIRTLKDCQYGTYRGAGPGGEQVALFRPEIEVLVTEIKAIQAR